jgi:hypothetical protein
MNPSTYSKLAGETLTDYLKILREEILASCEALEKRDFEKLNASLLMIRSTLYWIELQASCPKYEFKGGEDRCGDNEDDGSYADSGAVD